MPLPAGTKLPAFSTTLQNSEPFSHTTAKGQWLVLYFYPKDDTITCTKQACLFRDNMEQFRGLHAVVIGVSPDSHKAHNAFITKYNLNYNLIVDEDHKLCTLFDTWKEKSLYGHKYMGVERTTYLVNPEGIIVETFEKVRVKDHVKKIVKAMLANGATA